MLQEAQVNGLQTEISVSVSWRAGWAGILVIAATWAPTLAAQDPSALLIDAQRSMVSRQQLQATLTEIDRMLSSSGYSSTLRNSKKVEADAIRERLTLGDFRPGDVIKVTVPDEPSFTHDYTVTQSRTIILPRGAELSVKGILRAEIQGYLTEKFGEMLRGATVEAVPEIRVYLTGAINHGGFVNAPANMLLTQLLQDPTGGGGPAGNAQMKRSLIKRGDTTVVDGPEFESAIRDGATLDQLNLRAGDEIRVAAKPASGAFWRVVGALGALSSLIYLGLSVFH